MNLTRNGLIVLISIIFVAVAATGLFALEQELQESVPSQASSAFITGHVVAVVYDEFGNIKAYTQSDNAIVEDGLQILVQELFSPSISGTIPSSTGEVSHMEIGKSATAADSDDTDIITPIASCPRDTIAVAANIATDDGGTPSKGTILAVVTATFDVNDNAACVTTGINEAALFNDVSAGQMFARNVFGSTVNLSQPGDSLDITWSFTFADT